MITKPHAASVVLAAVHCEDEMKDNIPFIVTIYVGEKNVPNAVVVGDALWCGICKPQPEPIEMPEIF